MEILLTIKSFVVLVEVSTPGAEKKLLLPRMAKSKFIVLNGSEVSEAGLEKLYDAASLRAIEALPVAKYLPKSFVSISPTPNIE